MRKPNGLKHRQHRKHRVNRSTIAAFLSIFFLAISTANFYIQYSIEETNADAIFDTLVDEAIDDYLGEQRDQAQYPPKQHIDPESKTVPIVFTLKNSCQDVNPPIRLPPHKEKSDDHVAHRHIYRGRVLEQFLQRTLNRAIAQSNVLIVGPDIAYPWSSMNNNTNDQNQKYILNESDVCNGSSEMPILSALKEGHGLHLVPTDLPLKKWYKQIQSNSESRPPNWFLLAYFIGNDDTSTTSESKDSIDSIFNLFTARTLLEETTLTYIVLEVYAEKIINKSIITGKKVEYNFVGLKAVKTLLSYKYKVQILAGSHFVEGYHPNHLFKSVNDVRKFLKAGADFAYNVNDEENPKFKILLFATQGLDLAIPSRLTYLDLNSMRACEESLANVTGHCDSKVRAKGLGQPIFQSCPERHEKINIEFSDSSSSDIKVQLDGVEMNHDDRELTQIWHGHTDPVKSEVACVRYTGVEDDAVACTTRILPAVNGNASSSPKTERKKYNVLSILVDPISRDQMERSLPITFELLKRLDFQSFSKYTPVGDNSGPNQAALFTGKPLRGGRDGVKSSTSHTSTQWIWDSFNDEGYVTLKAEDGCIENSNMIQSMKPNTTHGSQLHQMNCFDFDRPNCLGKDLMATHLLNYATNFMDVYSNPSHLKPWAAFLSFIDSHEDSSTLISYLDELLFNFIQTIDFTNTLVLVLSDHGLHYGQSFTTNGERERTEPILHIYLPDAMDKLHREQLQRNKNRFVTAFDIYETIKDVTGINKRQQQDRTGIDDKTFGSSLIQTGPAGNMCEQVPTIPQRYCELAKRRTSMSQKCTFVIEPPSILSFYADIPRTRRPSWPKCSLDEEPLVHETNTKCKCAFHNSANDVEWKTCALDGSTTIEGPAHTKTCTDNGTVIMERGKSSLSVNINVERDESVVHKSQQQQNSAQSALPNIIFLEIDSLSVSGASRHLPKTLQLLRSHRIELDDGNIKCPNGLCAATFDKASVVGQSSIPNQLAALSGCTDRFIHGSTKWNPDAKMKKNTYCYQKDIRNPWLFDVVKKHGYIDLFGDEFCYTGSPYIVQDNHFPLNSTYNLKSVFCPLEANWEILAKESSTNPKPCIDGRSKQEFAFEFIRSMFDAYTDVPKFVYLSSLAAHDYSLDFAFQPLGIEAYDEYLSSFLQDMLSRKDADNTVIILRSDHGVQGGPAPIDFSFQVEHMNHLFNLIVPQSMATPKLFHNQDKLVTGFDLYNTLRKLVSSPIAKNAMLQTFSYDILGDNIPSTRSCKQAKIPVQNCPCIEERVDLMPQFYVGQSKSKHPLKVQKKDVTLFYDPKLRKLRSPKFPGKKVQSESVALLDSRGLRSLECQVNYNSPSFRNQDYQYLWDDINNITAKYPGAKLSGGLFLYPKQSVYFNFMIEQHLRFFQGINYPKTTYNVCETGFGAGHSAAFFLSLHPRIKVYTFDKFDRPYQMEVIRDLQKKYPERLEYVKGDTCETVPRYFKQNQRQDPELFKCDFIHGSSLCKTDNEDLVKYAGGGVPDRCNKHRFLTSTAMKSLEDDEVYFGKNGSWTKLVQQKCITDIHCFQEEERDLKETFVFARKGDEHFQHYFCVARITGKCHNNRFNTAQQFRNTCAADPMRKLCKSHLERFVTTKLLEGMRIKPLSHTSR